MLRPVSAWPPTNVRLRRGEACVHLTPKAFDLLVLLVRSPGHLQCREALIERCGRQTVVEEHGLTWNISALRRALGDDGEITAPTSRPCAATATGSSPPCTVRVRPNRPRLACRPPTTTGTLPRATAARPAPPAVPARRGRVAAWPPAALAVALAGAGLVRRAAPRSGGEARHGLAGASSHARHRRLPQPVQRPRLRLDRRRTWRRCSAPNWPPATRPTSCPQRTCAQARRNPGR